MLSRLASGLDMHGCVTIATNPWNRNILAKGQKNKSFIPNENVICVVLSKVY